MYVPVYTKLAANHLHRDGSDKSTTLVEHLPPPLLEHSRLLELALPPSPEELKPKTTINSTITPTIFTDLWSHR